MLNCDQWRAAVLCAYWADVTCTKDHWSADCLSTLVKIFVHLNAADLFVTVEETELTR